ncbi:hypothetical protein GCM10028802_21870 [Terrabacter terrigena]
MKGAFRVTTKVFRRPCETLAVALRRRRTSACPGGTERTSRKHGRRDRAGAHWKDADRRRVEVCHGCARLAAVDGRYLGRRADGNGAGRVHDRHGHRNQFWDKQLRGRAT